jgi:hypothetical protein
MFWPTVGKPMQQFRLKSPPRFDRVPDRALAGKESPSSRAFLRSVWASIDSAVFMATSGGMVTRCSSP